MGPGLIDEATAHRLLDYRARGGLLSESELDALISYHCACAIKAERAAVAKASAWTSQRPTAGKWWVAIHPVARRKFDVDAMYKVEIRGEAIHYEDDGTSDWYSLRHEIYDGAMFLPRETPADPFAGTE